jgi:hypothetical protein
MVIDLGSCNVGEKYQICLIFSGGSEWVQHSPIEEIFHSLVGQGKHFWGEATKHRSTNEQLDMLVDLKGKIASSSYQSETIFHNFEELSLGLFSSFDKSIGQSRSDNETFKYWDTFMCLI